MGGEAAAKPPARPHRGAGSKPPKDLGFKHYNALKTAFSAYLEQKTTMPVKEERDVNILYTGLPQCFYMPL